MENIHGFFITEFQKIIPKLATISEFLSKKREPARYGSEIEKKPPSDLFNKEAAWDTYKESRYCLKQIKKVFQE